MYPEGNVWCRVTEATGGPEINQSQRVYCRIYWCVCKRSRALHPVPRVRQISSHVDHVSRSQNVIPAYRRPRHLPLIHSYSRTFSSSSFRSACSHDNRIEPIAQLIIVSLSCSLARSFSLSLSLSLSRDQLLTLYRVLCNHNRVPMDYGTWCS